MYTVYVHLLSALCCDVNGSCFIGYGNVGEKKNILTFFKNDLIKWQSMLMVSEVCVLCLPVPIHPSADKLPFNTCLRPHSIKKSYQESDNSGMSNMENFHL